MSRIFIANADGKPSVIMNNFELNNTFIKNMIPNDKIEIRNSYFEYVKKLAKKII
ncbi:hypothetical protein IJD44_01480 [bacterium]|nr:hypothetical protein [bacterium]